MNFYTVSVDSRFCKLNRMIYRFLRKELECSNFCQLIFSQKHSSSFILNSLGLLCLWQCFSSYLFVRRSKWGPILYSLVVVYERKICCIYLEMNLYLYIEVFVFVWRSICNCMEKNYLYFFG